MLEELQGAQDKSFFGCLSVAITPLPMSLMVPSCWLALGCALWLPSHNAEGAHILQGWKECRSCNDIPLSSAPLTLNA